jgi:hypothetical protein
MIRPNWLKNKLKSRRMIQGVLNDKHVRWEPTSSALALAALITAGVGTSLSAYGMYQQAESAKAAASASEDIAAANAEAARSKAAYEEELQRDKLKTIMGQQRSRYAAAGVGINTGSPLLMLQETAAEGEKEALAIRWGGEVNAANYLNQGIMAGYEGEQAYTAGMLSAGSTFLTGLGQSGMTYYQYKNNLGPFAKTG